MSRNDKIKKLKKKAMDDLLAIDYEWDNPARDDTGLPIEAIEAADPDLVYEYTYEDFGNGQTQTRKVISYTQLAARLLRTLQEGS
jgi:hypothetical protein